MTREDKIKNITESFTYDNLNRLTGSHVAGQDAINLSYKDNGNIFSKSDVGGDDYPRSANVSDFVENKNSVRQR